MRVVGGKMGPDGKLGAFVTHIIKGGPADMAGIVESKAIRKKNIHCVLTTVKLESHVNLLQNNLCST